MTVQNLISLVGMFAMIGLAWLLSTDRKRVNWRTVGWGLALQFVFAVIVLRVPLGKRFFAWMNEVITGLLSYSDRGAEFIFGGAFRDHFFAFAVLPTIIFVSSLMAVLYYLNVMQRIVYVFAVVMTRFMGTSGAESLSASANIFVGQTEAPLLIRPYVERMTISELFCIMTGGMATVAGGVMAAYVGFLRDFFPNIAGHLLTASILSAPAALVMAKIMVPETEEPLTAGSVKMHVEVNDANVIDAAARGASEGMSLCLNVGAMLLAFIALIALLNSALTATGDFAQSLVGHDPWSVRSATLAQQAAQAPPGAKLSLSFQNGPARVEAAVASVDLPAGKLLLATRLPAAIPQGAAVALTADGAPLSEAADATGSPGVMITFELLSSILFFPLAFLMGVPFVDCAAIAELLGKKVIVNEFVAYLDLTGFIREGRLVETRSVVIATYALCGFSNFSSIAIQIGGIGAIAPSRRGDLARLGVKSVISGSLACFLTANVAGALFDGETVLLKKTADRPAVERVLVAETAPDAPAASAVR